jgi:hypothetical protein
VLNTGFKREIRKHRVTVLNARLTARPKPDFKTIPYLPDATKQGHLRGMPPVRDAMSADQAVR